MLSAVKLDQMLKMVWGAGGSILYTCDFRSNNVDQDISSAAGTNLEREGDIKNRETA